jgi:hypothetical protein
MREFADVKGMTELQPTAMWAGFVTLTQTESRKNNIIIIAVLASDTAAMS